MPGFDVYKRKDDVVWVGGICYQVLGDLDFRCSLLLHSEGILGKQDSGPGDHTYTMEELFKAPLCFNILPVNGLRARDTITIRCQHETQQASCKQLCTHKLETTTQTTFNYLGVNVLIPCFFLLPGYLHLDYSLFITTLTRGEMKDKNKLYPNSFIQSVSICLLLRGNLRACLLLLFIKGFNLSNFRLTEKVEEKIV